MADNKHEYKGPSETVVSLGQSANDSLIGGVAGTIGGAAVGALMHNPEKHEEVKIASEVMSKKFMHDLKYAFKEGMEEAVGESWKKSLRKGHGISFEAIETAERVTKENGFLGNMWHGMGRGGKAITAAIIGALAVSQVAQITGLFRGQKIARAARQQFDDITTENQLLQQKLDVTEKALQEKTSFVDALQKERSAVPAVTPER